MIAENWAKANSRWASRSDNISVPTVGTYRERTERLITRTNVTNPVLFCERAARSLIFGDVVFVLSVQSGESIEVNK